MDFDGVTNNCWLYIEFTIPALSTGVFRITYDANNDLTTKVLSDKTAASISSLAEKIIYVKSTDEDGEVFLIEKLFNK